MEREREYLLQLLIEIGEMRAKATLFWTFFRSLSSEFLSERENRGRNGQQTRRSSAAEAGEREEGGREGAQTRRSQGKVPNEKKGDWNHKKGFRAHTAIFLHICTNPGNFITTKKAS